MAGYTPTDIAIALGIIALATMGPWLLFFWALFSIRNQIRRIVYELERIVIERNNNRTEPWIR
jgi:hypothetical protein